MQTLRRFLRAPVFDLYHSLNPTRAHLSVRHSSFVGNSTLLTAQRPPKELFDVIPYRLRGDFAFYFHKTRDPMYKFCSSDSRMKKSPSNKILSRFGISVDEYITWTGALGTSKNFREAANAFEIECECLFLSKSPSVCSHSATNEANAVA
jgi:hypothetical protein